MLDDALSIWTCVYCGTKNDHTDNRCWNCAKKKAKLSTVKRILTLRKKKEKNFQEVVKTEQIKKLDPLPEQPEINFTFDLTKLKVD